MRDYRNDLDRGVEHAAGRPADERETERVPERAPEEVVTGLLFDGKKLLATIAETSIPKLVAAQATEGDRRRPQQRRAEYDLAAEGIEVEFNSAAVARAHAVTHAKRHQLDVQAMLEDFDQRVADARLLVNDAPRAPARFERVRGEDGITQALAMPPGVERNTELTLLFSELDPAIARVLHRRLASDEPDPEDALATAFKGVTSARQDLLGILDGTRKVRIDRRRFGGAQKTPETPAPAPGTLGALAEARRQSSVAPSSANSTAAPITAKSPAAPPDVQGVVGGASARAKPPAGSPELPRKSEASALPVQSTSRAGTPAVQGKVVADGPVQRKATGGTTRTTEAVASRGFEGGGGPLPHVEQIQASFGRHDVSNVKAHHGPAAKEAAAELGAEAYASGNSVAFAQSPDLRTAAHEAAHTVQQRFGVQLLGGLDGGADDPYERHADEVAEAVVSGRSAEPLLDQMAGQSHHGAVVQRAPARSSDDDKAREAVVSGRSAEPLLDQMAGQGHQGAVVQRAPARSSDEDKLRVAVVSGSSANARSEGRPGHRGAVVQRAPARNSDEDKAREGFNRHADYQLFQAERAGASITAPAYLHLHMAEVRHAIYDFLLGRPITPGDAQVSFVDGLGPFLAATLKPLLGDDSARHVELLRDWIAPEDVFAVVDRNRAILEPAKSQKRAGLDYAYGAKGPPAWKAAVGTAIGSALEVRMLDSIARMSARLVYATAKQRQAGQVVTEQDLVPSHPLDWAVALGMLGRGSPTVRVAGGTLEVDPRQDRHHWKIKKLTWQGGSGGPWNAVKVEPDDAGPESVAGHLFGSAIHAYKIKRIGPYYLIPAVEAIRIPEAAKYFRLGGSSAEQLAFGTTAGSVENAEAERALAAEPQVVATGAQLVHAWEGIGDQLRGIALVVQPYGLDAKLAGVRARHTAQKLDLARLSGHDAIVRSALLASQGRLLTRIAAEIGTVVGHTEARRPQPKADDPVAVALGRLVRAANLSHLAETGEAALDEAHAVQRDSIADGLEAMLAQTATQLELARLTMSTSGTRSRSSTAVFGASLGDRADALRTRLAVFRSDMLHGQVDPAQLESLRHDVDALGFEARIVAEVGQLGELFETIGKLEDGNWLVFSEYLGATGGKLLTTARKTDHDEDDNHIGRLEHLRRGAFTLRGELQTIHAHWLETEQVARAVAEKLAAGGAKDADQKAKALVQPQIDAIRAKLKKLGGQADVQAFLRHAYRSIDDAQLQATIVQIGILIGITILSGGLAAEFIAAAGLATGSISAIATGMLVETVSFTALEALLSGEPMLAAFASNGIGNLATFGAMRGLNRVLKATAIGKTLAKAGEATRAAVLLAKGAELTASMLVATGVQIAQAEYMALLKEGRTLTMEELAAMSRHGMAMMIGAHLGHSVLGEPGSARMARGELAARRARLRKLAADVEAAGDTSLAVELMRETRAYIEAEAAQAHALSEASDAELAAQGLTRKDVTALAKYATAASAVIERMDAGSLAAQVGLHTVVPGRVYSGPPDAVEVVIGDYRKRGYTIETRGADFRVSKRGESLIDIFVKPVEGSAKAAPDRARTVTTGRTPEHSVHGEPAAAPHEPQPHDGAAPSRIVLAGADKDLLTNAQKVKPLPGYIDVILHADANTFWLVQERVDIAIDHRALATYLKKHGLEGARLRLLACESGQSAFAVAQDLANKLGVDVLAPTKTVWIDPSGRVGVGRRGQDEGTWEPFSPKREPVAGRPRKEPYREPAPMRTEDGSEVDAPLHVQAPRVDTRARVRAEELRALSAELGVPVVIDPALHNGVEVQATQRKGLLGYDMTSVVIRVGTAALKSDVMAHARTIEGLRRYNGVLGKLRGLSKQMPQGRTDGEPGSAAPKAFPPGSRGRVTQTELTKLEELIEARNAQRRDGLIDDATLFDELAFLNGELARHNETLRSMADTGYLHDETVTVTAPDIGVVTREAQALGYKLPGEAGGVGEHADPSHYYYRRTQHDAEQFELVRKPTAPVEAVAYRARVVTRTFQGLEEAAAGVPKEVVPTGQTKQQVVARLRETEGFGPYAEMLEAQGIASRAVIDAAVATMRGRKNQVGQEVTLDWLRHEVKDYFRDRVLKKLLDPSLDPRASYRNMRNMLDGLGNADRGALVEVWYRERNAPIAETHVRYQVTRTSGDNEGSTETREADLVVGREIREVKHIDGKIDEEQFGAYVDLLRDDKLSKQMGVDRLRYIFTKPEGAIANRERIVDALGDRELRDRFAVEVFDSSGTSHLLTTPEQALALLVQLKTKQGNP